MEDLRLSSITLTFENCETMTIPATLLGNFYLSNITEEISRMAYNAITKYKTANSVIIEISKEILNLKIPSSFSFLNKREENKDEEDSKSYIPRYQLYDDITEITITYLDSSDKEIEEYYLVPWEEDQYQENDFQETITNKNGDTLIIISNNSKELEETRDSYEEFFHDESYEVTTYDYVNDCSTKSKK